MRPLLTALLWCVATLATVVAIGAGWTAAHVQSESGFVRLVSAVGDDPEVQAAAADVAGEAFADQTGLPIAWHDRIAARTRDAVLRFTASQGWSEAWRETTRRTHQRLYADQTPTDLRADVAPLVGVAVGELAADLPFDLGGPDELWVTVSEEDPGDLVGVTSQAGTVAVVAVGTALVAALLTLVVSRRRSTTWAALGAGALLAAGTWWVLGRVTLPRLVEDRAADTGADSDLQQVLVDRVVGSLDATLVWVAVAGAAMVAAGLVSRALRS
ncbi:hypothetical protein AFL01nite_12590 [Aeromicrobium flavum]|uniref:Uncharacterized protein n=1 Tax=Aeromicrobium flavum TaxID=416568 RepID=A0A512HU04_9ACTN|nr:hypothetical protein [Aeromicrobium flavum]GEO88932.1 hypothetical protein AFL01nite_12590 [Aeromicrobium flavum]